jgi:hypothetical protein
MFHAFRRGEAYFFSQLVNQLFADGIFQHILKLSINTLLSRVAHQFQPIKHTAAVFPYYPVYPSGPDSG